MFAGIFQATLQNHTKLACSLGIGGRGQSGAGAHHQGLSALIQEHFGVRVHVHRQLDQVLLLQHAEWLVDHEAVEPIVGALLLRHAEARRKAGREKYEQEQGGSHGVRWPGGICPTTVLRNTTNEGYWTMGEGLGATIP